MPIISGTQLFMYVIMILVMLFPTAITLSKLTAPNYKRKSGHDTYEENAREDAMIFVVVTHAILIIASLVGCATNNEPLNYAYVIAVHVTMYVMVVVGSLVYPKPNRDD